MGKLKTPRLLLLRNFKRDAGSRSAKIEVSFSRNATPRGPPHLSSRSMRSAGYERLTSWPPDGLLLISVARISQETSSP